MLTKDGRKLKIFEDGIAINRNLSKWKNSKERIRLRKETGKEAKPTPGTIYIASTTPNGTTSAISPTTSVFLETGDDTLIMNPDESRRESFKKVDFGEAAMMDIKALTDFINEKGADTIFGRTYGNSFNDVFITNLDEEVPEASNEKSEAGFFKRLTNKLLSKAGKKETYAMDVISFFENVKLVGKASAENYKFRVEKYLAALHTADITGQTALKEKLAREMFVNKYEAELYANGLYYVVDESKVVEFANKTEKGVELMYLSNFARPLPDKVVEKLGTVDKLEVFDNYAVLCYDPDGTKKLETEAERDKRKDPILFGLICGSDKLYYITDWVDEYCDLTLQQFVDTLEIKKSDLKMK